MVHLGFWLKLDTPEKQLAKCARWAGSLWDLSFPPPEVCSSGTQEIQVWTCHLLGARRELKPCLLLGEQSHLWSSGRELRSGDELMAKWPKWNRAAGNQGFGVRLRGFWWVEGLWASQVLFCFSLFCGQHTFTDGSPIWNSDYGFYYHIYFSTGVKRERGRLEPKKTSFVLFCFFLFDRTNTLLVFL